MKAYRLVTGTFVALESADRDGDRSAIVRDVAATCLAILGQHAEQEGITDWIGVITADELTDDRRVTINMQMAVAV